MKKKLFILEEVSEVKEKLNCCLGIFFIIILFNIY